MIGFPITIQIKANNEKPAQFKKKKLSQKGRTRYTCMYF
jgi:hypothetical protein